MTDTPLTWMQTSRSRKLDLLRPQDTPVDWIELADALSRIARFNGHAEGPDGEAYSVAQHSCLVHDNLPKEYRLAGLLHDAHEYALGDWTTPVQNALVAEVMADLGGVGALVKNAIKRLKARHDAVIFAAAGCALPLTADCAAAVKEADARALMTERRDLFAKPSPESWGTYENFKPFDGKIVVWKRWKAAHGFLWRLQALTGRVYREGEE